LQEGIVILCHLQLWTGILLLLLVLVVGLLVRNMRDRRHAEELLREKERRFRRYFDVDLVGMAMTSAEMAWLDVNDRMCDMLGYSREELLRITWADLTHPEDLPRDLKQFRRMEIGEIDGYSLDKRFIRKDGQVIDTLLSVKGFWRSNGSLDYQVAMVQDVSERRRAAEALEKRRVQLAEAQRLAHLGSWELDVHTGRMSCSVEFYRLLGVDPEEEACQDVFLSQLHPEDRGRILRLLEQSLDGHGAWNAEYRIVRPDGEIRHVAVQTELSFDEAGRPLWILGATLDITERKHAEEESRLNESRLAAALALHRMADAPVENICRFALESAARLTKSKLGFLNFGDDPHAAMQGVFWTRETCRQCATSSLPSSLPMGGSRFSREVLRTGKALVCNETACGSGEERLSVCDHIHLERHLYVPVIERGEVVAIAGVGNKTEDYNATDIRQMTLLMQVVWRLLQRRAAQREREQALAEAEESRDRIDVLIRSVGDGLIVIDEQRHVVLLNPAVEGLLGVRSADVLGQPVDSLVEGERFRTKLRNLADVENGQPFYVELRRPGDIAVRHLRGRISGMCERIGKGREYVVSLQDVTRERELDRMKTEFISTAAHELRTPMTSILGFAELLLGRTDLDEAQQRELLGIIHEKTYLLSQIVNDLLDMSRIEAGRGISLQCTLCDVNQVLGGWVRGLRQEDPRHRVLVKLPEQPVMLMIDRGKIIQVLENLFSNASKFSSPGKRIWLTGRLMGGAFHVSVRDEGIGMTEQQVARVFDKFYRADMSNTGRPGLGLGMSIVKNIVEAHGGRIQVNSEVGEGTEVGFFLPPLS
jgi:PAS domain S-box-containing protein